MTRMFLTCAALLGLAFPAVAADPKLEGNWEGTLKLNDDISLKVIYRITKGAAGYSGTMDSPDEGATGIKLSTVTLKKSDVTIAIKSNGSEYKGKINSDNTKIDGKYSIRGKEFALVLTPAGPEKPAAKPDEMWSGKLQVQAGIELRLVFNLFKQKDGSYTATMDSPDQNAKGIKVDKVTRDKTTLAFSVKRLAAEYSGKFNETGDEVTGTFKQAGMSMTLNMKKTDKVEETRRTQMPKGPFPYQEIEVAYPNKEAGNELAGTLTLPKGDGPFPVVVMISGSGQQDRDETLLGHKPFLVLADYLTRRGIGVLRFDDRGAGGSTGKHATATSADFATDVQAGVDFLKARKDIDPKRIGLMGHSEGGLIAPMVAVKSPDDIAFIVLLAGPGVPGNEILEAQSTLILKAMGVSEEDALKNVAAAKQIYEIIRTEKDDAVAKKAIDALVKASLEKLTEAERKAAGPNPAATAEGNLKLIMTPWFRYFLTYDPRPTLAKVKCPVLAINGEKDLQVPPGQNLPMIEKAIKGGGNTNVTVKELKGLNHLFQTSKTGAPSEYAAIEETFSPAALQIVGDWITALK